MIITAPSPDDYWTCLVRRGMLHSETESIEHWTLVPEQTLSLGRYGVHETFVILSGETVFEGVKLLQGSVLVAEANEPGQLKAVVETTLVSIRTYPEKITQMLPQRIPELPESDRAI